MLGWLRPGLKGREEERKSDRENPWHLSVLAREYGREPRETRGRKDAKKGPKDRSKVGGDMQTRKAKRFQCVKPGLHISLIALSPKMHAIRGWGR